MIKKIFNCISIHNGGGIVYLSMMHSEIDKKGNLILLDYRAKNKLQPFKNAEIKFFKRNFFRNLIVFKERVLHFISFQINPKNKNNFFHEYYLNGLPPLFRLPISNNKVFILFQNKNLFCNFYNLNKNNYFKLSFILYHFLHKTLINFFLKDSDNIIVQTNSMKKLIKSCKSKNTILVHDKYWQNLNIDFYHTYFKNLKIEKQNKLLSSLKRLGKDNTLFFYPASFYPHKNHKILISSFEKVSKEYSNKTKLLLTIDSNEFINRLKDNQNIIFLGSPSLNTIFDIYSLADFLIFPSLNESLGLPLLEAKINELPIIASDLDYVYDICNPIYTFNPYSVNDIYEKILKVIKI